MRKRHRFLREVSRIALRRLVFLDEAALNLAMSRSHAWVKRGEEFIDRVPTNWGKHNLTLLGAIRVDGWLLLTTKFGSTNKQHFVAWLKRMLLPRLRRGDVLVMNNLSAHHDPRVTKACSAVGVRLLYLPPYSPDLNPIESGWALQKQHVRQQAPRSPDALRRIARHARRRVTTRHCRGWFRHCGYTGPLR